MEQFYLKIRKRSDEKPWLIGGIIALFYLFMGMGFMDMRSDDILSVIIYCILCFYMATLVYAVVKGNVLKGMANCVPFFLIGALARFILRYGEFSFTDLGIAVVVYAVFYAVGIATGWVWYGKYIKGSK